jgi:hypothetical protein
MVPELANPLAQIEELRRQISGLLAELPARALNWRPSKEQQIMSPTILAALAAPVAVVGHVWITELIGHQPEIRKRPV